jgi:hypothetical protein
MSLAVSPEIKRNCFPAALTAWEKNPHRFAEFRRYDSLLFHLSSTFIEGECSSGEHSDSFLKKIDPYFGIIGTGFYPPDLRKSIFRGP